MKPVTKEEFFAIIGPRDIHPKVDPSSLKFRWHISHWETPGRKVVGLSRSDSWGIEEPTYQLVDANHRP